MVASGAPCFTEHASALLSTKDKLVAVCLGRSLMQMGKAISVILDDPGVDPMAQLEGSVALRPGSHLATRSRNELAFPCRSGIAAGGSC